VKGGFKGKMASYNCEKKAFPDGM